jgi:hypothetical protein
MRDAVRVGDAVALPEVAHQYGAGVLRLQATMIGPASPTAMACGDR